MLLTLKLALASLKAHRLRAVGRSVVLQAMFVGGAAEMPDSVLHVSTVNDVGGSVIA